MPRRTILFNGGLVTSRDPSILQSDRRVGELSVADNAEYLPDDPGIWPCKGRTAFNATAESGPILSAGFFEFEPDIAKIITLVGSTYRIATMAPSGSFNTLLSGLNGSATFFDQVSHRNQHLLMNGVDRNQVVESDSTIAPQGMLANTAPPTADASGGTGITLSSGAVLHYWVEERVKSGTTIVRRNAASAATIVTVTGPITNKDIVITRPAIRNSDATHWALFGSATNVDFPNGAEISEVVIGTTSITDTRNATDPELPTGAIYPTVAVEFLGQATITPKYGEPPISNTGDVFEGSIVQNDVANESHVRFTFPDDIHAHPAINVINIRTKFKDRVVWIRSLGRGVMVGMEHGLWRIDTLPLPEDAGFQPDRVKTEIEGAHGAVAPLAVAPFSFGQGAMLAYVSQHGIIVTDGSGWDVLTADIDWEALVSTEQLAKTVLINNPRMYRLEMYFTDASGARKAMYFHYHPSHIKGSLRAKVTGPIDVAANDAFVGHLETGGIDFHVWTAQADGKLYREGVGVTTAAFRIRTGSLYLNGIGGEAIHRRAWIHHSAGTSVQDATWRIVMEAEGETDTERTETFSVARREASFVGEEGIADSFQYAIEASAPPARVRYDYVEIDYEPADEEQSP